MNSTYKYIDTMEDAEYEVLDTGMHDNFINDNKGTLANVLANVLDRFAAGRKGQLFTTGINVGGYAKNSDSLLNHYNQNAEVIDTYFSHIDLQALANDIGGDLEEKMVTGSVEWLKRQVPAFLAGAGGIALLIYLKQRRA